MDRPLAPAERRAALAAPLFSGCPEEAVDQVMARPECSLQAFRCGQTLYRPDCFQRSLGILLSGRVQVSRDALLISTLGPGELFGAAALFNDQPDYATTLTALEECRAVFLPQMLLSALLDESPRIRENYIRYLSGRIRFLSGKVQTLSASGAQSKLARYLRSAAAPGGPLPGCSATELARRLGVSRASLYRAFDALEARGAIRREGNTILVLDPDALGCPDPPHHHRKERSS